MSTPIKTVFGPAPILQGENSKAYDELLEQVSGLIGPSDIFEHIWVAELVGLIWEIRRYQEYKALVIKAAIPKALEQIIAPFVNGPWKYGAMEVYDSHGALKPTVSMEIVNDWVCGKPEGIKTVEEVLFEGNLTMKDVEARAMILALDQLRQIDDLIARLVARRDRLLGQIERRRVGSAERLRRAAREAGVGEFEKADSKRLLLAAYDDAA